jgi:benzoyl-CoA-dihydrodiol lyase
VDEAVPRVGFADVVAARAAEIAARSTRPRDARGITLTPLASNHVRVNIDRAVRAAEITIFGPTEPIPAVADIEATFWPLAMARELDDTLLHLRTNELEIGTWMIRSIGDPERVVAYDAFLREHADHWLVNEVIHAVKRTFKRLDYSSRSIIALIEPGSCFAGTLAELVLAADRSYHLDGLVEGTAGAPAAITVTDANLGLYPMGNGLSRLATRFFYDPDALAAAAKKVGEPLVAADAIALGLVTSTPDDLDWDDEVRLAVEERASFSPDALTGLEANFRFVGPETRETKIFGRLTAWQNWIFMRPNASGAEGALRRYGTGQRPTFDRRRV